MVDEQVIKETPEYRVHIVRMWGREFLDGFQFVYKHESTGEIVDGPRRGTPLVDNVPDDTDFVEFRLYPHEYIVAVRGREGAWTDALELETVRGRVFRAGGQGGGAFERHVAKDDEVRLLEVEQGVHLINVQPVVSPARRVQFDPDTIKVEYINEKELTAYHSAVFHSEGDMDTFVLLERLVVNPQLVNNEMEVDVIENGEPKHLAIQPHVLASYFGYVAIVDYFFSNFPELVPKEKKEITQTRATKTSPMTTSA